MKILVSGPRFALAAAVSLALSAQAGPIILSGGRSTAAPGGGSGGCAAPDNEFEETVCGMSAGTWAELDANSQDSVLGNQPGSSDSMLLFGNAAAWNPGNQSIEIVGADHTGVGSPILHTRLTLSTNTYTVVQAAGVIPGIGHNYDHQTVNPHTGDMYQRPTGGVNGSPIEWYRKTLGAGSFTNFNDLTNVYHQFADGITWWSGSFTGGSGCGVQGCLMYFNSADGTCIGAVSGDGRLSAYDPIADSWVYQAYGASPGSCDALYGTIEYSATKNVAVLGGGSDDETNVTRVNSNGTFTVLTDVPAGHGIGPTIGNFVDEPATGNFLLMDGGQLRELNPDGAGTWTTQGGSRVPPSPVVMPDEEDGVISVAIPCDHDDDGFSDDGGVVVYISQAGDTGGNTYIYKHADCP